MNAYRPRFRASRRRHHDYPHDEKRIWLKEFGSAEVWSALFEYLTSTNLSESAKRRVQDALARRE
jgi:hypothetical protein